MKKHETSNTQPASNLRQAFLLGENMKHSYNVLDAGFINVYDDGIYGSDTTIVNAARVSFGKRIDEICESDVKLLNYLGKNKHHSPFRHAFVQFHVKAPEFVARQWYKHVVGAETTSSYATKDHAWNEISGRYIKIDDFYAPSEWRAQSKDNKQASEGLIEDQQAAAEQYEMCIDLIRANYKVLIDLGVSKEQARMLLPLSMYTEFYWTASFQAIMNFIDLRDHNHAQIEIQEYAKQIKKIMNDEFPKATEAWLTQKE